MAKRLLDFRQIRWNQGSLDIENYNQLHQKALDFLKNTFEPIMSNTSHNPLGQETDSVKNLVISHHLPSFLNFPKKHLNDPINASFASNLDDFILKLAPNAWIYGHHHSNIPPFFIGQSLLYTNQLGVVKFKESPGFNRSAVLVV